MNKNVLLFISIILCSCIKFPHDDPIWLSNYNDIQNSIVDKIGNSTNCDILKKLKIPLQKTILHNNQKYSYHYINTSINQYEYEESIFIFENDILCAMKIMSVEIGRELDKNNHYTNKHKLKYEINKCKQNDGRDNLGDEWDDSRYKLVDIPISPEIDIKNLDDNEFLQKIPLNSKKGLLLRLIGKPNYSYDYDEKEIWKFVIKPSYKNLYGDNLSNFNERNVYRPKGEGGKEYFIVFNNDIVVDRYIKRDLYSRIGYISHDIFSNSEQACIDSE